MNASTAAASLKLCAALAVAVALASACTSTTLPQTSGNFAGPSGLAITGAGDRDLLFISSSGTDDLRAINLCTTPTLPDGGAPVTTCPATEDFHYVPGPIRVFPGSLPVGNRPVRLAGVRLLGTDQKEVGVLLVAGAEASLRVVDPPNVVQAMNQQAAAKPPQLFPLDTPPVDVIAFEKLPDAQLTAGASAHAYVLTQSAPGVPAQLTALDVNYAAAGPVVAATGRCALDFIATRLALIPGQDDLLYVADGSPDAIPGGKGDGAVEIATAAIPAIDPASIPACTIRRRIVATDPVTGAAQPLRALALSPPYHTSADPAVDRIYDAGTLLLAATQAGRIVFLRTDLPGGGPAPLPTITLEKGVQAPILMEDLRVNGLAREVAFLTPPTDSGPADKPFGRCPVATEVGKQQPPHTPCTIIATGNSTTGFHSPLFSLAAIVTSSDGGTYFLDADKRRFVSDLRDGVTGEPPPIPVIDLSTVSFGPTQPIGTTAPTFTFAPVQTAGTDGATSTRLLGWVTPGVTRKAHWRIVWHAPVPGLERRGGALARAPDGVHLRFTLPGVDLTRWTLPNQLEVGDVVSFQLYARNDGQPLCDELTAENTTPLAREFRISAILASAAVGSTNALDLEPQGNLSNGTTFAIPDSCLPAGNPLGATAELRVAGTRPWLVLQGPEVRGRAAQNQLFIGFESRFDYPVNFDDSPIGLGHTQPTPDTDIGVAFTVGGSEPVVPQSSYVFDVNSGQSPTAARDNGTTGGFAGPVIVYTSPKVTNLSFTSITGGTIGGNSVLQVDPALLAVLNGVIAYR